MERTLDPAQLGDHLDRLYRAAWALCGSREDAEDLVQETYARVAVNDLTGTDVSKVNVDLAGPGGGGDGQPDRVIVNGTNGNDKINVGGDSGGVNVAGLAATVAVFRSEAANDRLEINTLAGTDNVNSRGLSAGQIQLFVDGALVA
jgi:hypothetical protein